MLFHWIIIDGKIIVADYISCRWRLRLQCATHRQWLSFDETKSVTSLTGDPIDKKLESIKWYLWHGNIYKALNVADDLLSDLDYEGKAKKLYKKLEEFSGYIKANSNFIPNYGDRYHYGEYISTGFVESTVNELVTRRMVKKQQMRWTKRGAHLLLQNRIKTLNNELRDCFCQWYKDMAPEAENEPILEKKA